MITDETRDKIIEDAIEKNMAITDSKLYEAVYSVAMDVYEAGVVAEREAVINVCEKWAKAGGDYSLIDAIRARGTE